MARGRKRQGDTRLDIVALGLRGRGPAAEQADWHPSMSHTVFIACPGGRTIRENREVGKIASAPLGAGKTAPGFCPPGLAGGKPVAESL